MGFFRDLFSQSQEFDSLEEARRDHNVQLTMMGATQQVAREVDAIKHKYDSQEAIMAEIWEINVRESFRILDEKMRLKRKEKLKSPKSIWIRKRALRKLF